MTGRSELRSRHIIQIRVDATSYSDAARRVSEWVRAGASRYVCACNVHMIMEAHDDPAFSEIVNGADLVTPDGMPLVWALQALGVHDATRVYGPDLMLELCRLAEQERIPVGLYGSTTAVLTRLVESLTQQFPLLRVPYVHSPPFGQLTDSPSELERIRLADVGILFVALGCPRQESWMARNRGRVPAVMVGVGAAFDFLAGAKPQAPRLLQNLGLEWAFRLATEPRRLWRRYLFHNPHFVALFGWQLATGWKTDESRTA